MSNNAGNTLLALLAGAAIGVVAGILLAPDKGSKTREKIKDGFEKAKNNLKKKFNLQDNYEEMVSNMSHKTEDVIAFLEEKLADLKKQSAKFQK